VRILRFLVSHLFLDLGLSATNRQKQVPYAGPPARNEAIYLHTNGIKTPEKHFVCEAHSPPVQTDLPSQPLWLVPKPIGRDTFRPRLLNRYSSPPTTKREVLSRAMSGEAVGYRLNTVGVGFPRTVLERDPRLTPSLTAQLCLLCSK
jgi:hypothetical protein